MNDARFSMRLPRETLAFAQGYAAQCNMTLTDLLLRYLDRLRSGASRTAAARAAKRPVRNLDKYIGIARGMEHVTDEELDEMRFRHLSEKYA